MTHDYKGMPVAIKQQQLNIEEADLLSAKYRKANEEDEGQLIKEEELKEEEFVVDIVQNEQASSKKSRK